jgi:hypothetical protein
MNAPKKITLERSPEPDKLTDRFDRGERIIMVDGVRWGRTMVHSMGSRGTETTFVDMVGTTIGAPTASGRHFLPVRVMSASRKSSMVLTGTGYRLPDGFKDTEQLTLEKAIELVEQGKLRAPEIVEAELAEKAAELRANREARKALDDREFRTRAAIAVTLSVTDPLYSDALDRVIAAMRWAQEK